MKCIQGAVLWAVVALFVVLPLTALAQDPDLVVTISESDDPVYAGVGGVGNLTYIVSVENAGDADANNVELTVTLTLPAGVTVSGTDNFNGSVSGSNPYTLDSTAIVAPGELGSSIASLTIDLTVAGTAGAATDAITIDASITDMDETDSDTNNDFATEHTSISTIATFQVSKDFSDDNTAAVDIQLTCSGGEVDLDPQPTVSEGQLVGLVVTDFPADTSCTVTETVPAGYTESYAEGCTLDPVGSTLGNYPCLITNTQDAVQLVVNKTFEDGNTADVTVSVQCAEGTVTPDDPTASGSDPAEFSISDFPAGGTTCTATETLPTGYAQLSSTCTDVAIGVAGTPSCEFVNVPLRTTFAVTKEFTDGDNPTEVEVTINCFTGLPLEQSQAITEDQGVEFVVTDFDIGELDCEITEENLAGYTPTYEPDGPGDFNAEGGCNFEDVGGGAENTCHIVNDADPVDVVIEKLWVIEGAGVDQVDTHFKLELFCDAEIADASYCQSNNDLVESPAGLNGIWTCKKTFYGEGSAVFTGHVTPEYPSSHCWVEEGVYESSVEIDNDCGNLVISAGNGASCVITNTVFFEGIPTLSQFGLALMALLMLGVGLVGFRRFA